MGCSPWGCKELGTTGRLHLLTYFAIGVSNMIAKLAKTCTLRISPDKLNFILSDRVANGGVSMWCELEQVSGGS